MPWTHPLDKPEPDIPMNDSIYRMKSNVSPVKRKATLAMIPLERST